MNYSNIHKHTLLVLLLLHSTSAHSYTWSYYWSNVCTTMYTLSYKVKLALALTAAAIVVLLCTKKKKPSSSSSVERDHIINRQAYVNGQRRLRNINRQSRVLQGSEAIVNAMLKDAPSDQILPLITAGSTSPEELNRESDIFLPLGLACAKGREDLIKALVENGAEINKANRRNKTPLRIALSSYRGPCDFPIIEYLLSKGADPRDYRHSAPAVKALLDQARSQGQSQERSARRCSLSRIHSGEHED